MKKRALSILLVLVLILATGTVTAFLAVADSNEAKIGDTEYATLAAAIDKANDGDTITLLRNVNVNYSETKNITAAITIDGTDAKYTMTLSSNYPFAFYKSFTLKNLKIVANRYCFRMFNTAGAESIGTFDNVDATLNGNGMLINIQGSAGNTPQTLNLINSTVTKASTSADPLLATYSHISWARPGIEDITINIENSTLTQNGGNTDGEYGNATLFNFCRAKTVTLNLKGNTVLNYNPKGQQGNIQTLISYEVPTTMNVEATASLNLLGNGNPTFKNYFLYKNNAAGSMTLNDAGAAWNVSEKVAMRGFYLPNGSYTVNETGKALVNENASYGAQALTVRKSATAWTTADIQTDADHAYSGASLHVGKTYYTTWADAIAADGEIVLTGGAPAMTSLTKLTKDLTVSGKGGIYGSGYIFDLAGYNATFKGITLELTHGLRTDTATANTSNVLFEDCNVTITGGLLINYAKNANVTFKNTTITSSSGDPVILTQSGATAQIDFVGSSVTYTKGSGTADNASVINVASKSKVTVTLDGTSAIHYAPSNASVTQNHIITVHDAETVANITLKSGAVLDFAATSAAATSLTFIRNTQATVNLVDEGATWKVSEAVAKKGFSFVYHAPQTDTIGAATTNTDIVALIAGGKLYNPMGTISGLTAATEFKALNMGVSNVAGASIRLSDPSGIRFTTSIDKDFYAALGTNAVYGVKVVRQDALNGGSVADVAAENAVISASNADGFVWDIAGEQFKTVLVDIPESGYATKLAWTAYVTVTYADGSTATYYADWTETDNCRSLADVAKAALADTTLTWNADETAVLNKIAGNAN